MLKKIMVAALALAMLFCLTACAGESKQGSEETAESESVQVSTSPEYHSVSAIQERGVLCAGACASNKLTYMIPDDPEEYGDLAGTRDGYVPEITRKIAESLDVEIEFVEYESIDELLSALSNGDVDVAVANFEITEERLEKYEMTENFDVANESASDVYLSADPESGNKIKRESDLTDAHIGVVKGSVQAEATATQYPEADLEEFATNEEALQALAEGEVDAAVFYSFDRKFADKIVDEIVDGTVEQCDYKIADPDYLGQGFILMKGNEDLCQYINGQISELWGSGWLVECYETEEKEAKERGII